MSEPDETAVSPYERHRALVRQVDRKFSGAYGIGGGVALLSTVGTFLVLRFVVGMTGLLPWLLAVTALLVSMFVLRIIVRARRKSLLAELDGYCELNGLDRDALRNYYAADATYPYFISLFDDPSDRSAT